MLAALSLALVGLVAAVVGLVTQLMPRTFSRNGSRPPNLAAHCAPSSRSGAAAITASSVVPARSTPEGADGCAPIHSSASGPGAGTGRPCSSAIAVRVPHG